MKKLVIVLSVVVVLLATGVLFLNCIPFTDRCFSQGPVNEKVLSAHVNAADFKTAVESGKYKLIDIRTLDEYNSGHIKGADQIDFYQTGAFSDYLDTLDKNQKYIIYCRSGNRTGQALNIMAQKGFKYVSDLSGGINSWNASGYPLEK